MIQNKEDFEVKVYKTLKGVPQTIHIEVSVKTKPGKVISIKKQKEEFTGREINAIVKKCKSSYKEGLNLVI